MMKVNQLNKKSDKADVRKAKKAATKDLEYKYCLNINRALMLEYMTICKIKGSNAALEINQFVEKQVIKQRGKV